MVGAIFSMNRQRGFSILFVLLGVAAIIFSRCLFIELSPSLDDFPDIRIYQVVGKAILAGINPYDYSNRVEERRRLRLEMATTPDDFVAADQDVWDYYVSANPPGSSLLYAFLEKVAQGSRHAWRQLFIAGDILVFLGLCTLMTTLEGGLSDLRRSGGVFCLAVFYPLFSMAMPFVSEDKQFQTALLLFGAAMLLAVYRRSVLRDLLLGFILSLGVVFKVFGVILFPLWLSKLRRRPFSFALWCGVGGCVPLIAAYWAFGTGPIMALQRRSVSATGGHASSGSPWQLLPAIDPIPFHELKITIILLCCAGLAILFLKRKVDALNFSAGLGVVLGCLWLENGSMDRMNIVIMFAIASLATLSTARFLWMSLFMTGLSAFFFLFKIPTHGLNERIDGMVVAIFIVAYAVALLVPSFSIEDRKALSRVTV